MSFSFRIWSDALQAYCDELEYNDLRMYLFRIKDVGRFQFEVHFDNEKIFYDRSEIDLLSADLAVEIEMIASKKNHDFLLDMYNLISVKFDNGDIVLYDGLMPLGKIFRIDVDSAMISLARCLQVCVNVLNVNCLLQVFKK